LRPVEERHVDAMHALWIDPDVRRYLWDDIIITRDRAAEAVAASVSDFEHHAYGLWAVHLKLTGALGGFCGLRSTDDAPELLYGFVREYWGLGYATEAAGAVLDHAFRTLRMPAVDAATDAPNRASMRVLERLAMTFVRRAVVGGLDTVFYTVTREDFYNRRRT
jgi:[ribosomal protein S5]-alanine N-acetyltransferase